MDIILISNENYQNHQEDLFQISQLDEKYFPFPWSAKAWTTFLQETPFLCSVAVENESIIGFCLFSIGRHEQMAHLLKIIILNESRGNGYAKMLHSKIELELTKEDLKNLYLEVATNNESAIALYKSLGYKVLTTKKKFYSNGDDAYAMQKLLN